MLTVVVPTNGMMIAGFSVVVAFTISVLENTTMTTQEIVSMLAIEIRISSSSVRNLCTLMYSHCCANPPHNQRYDEESLTAPTGIADGKSDLVHVSSNML